MTDVPFRQVRAVFDAETITVYQAYSPAIAEPAAANGTFRGTPFKIERMTWIKPSFLWMMYRCGWATKEGQERVLAIRMSRTGFESALSSAALSHFEPGTYADHAQWLARKDASPVRVQWDPERGPRLEPLPWRSLQVGLSGPAVRSFVDDWIVGIDDITPTLEDRRRRPELLPQERPYPLPDDIATIIGATHAGVRT